MRKFFLIISLGVILSLGIVINDRKDKIDNEYLGIFIDNERVSEFPKKGEALYFKSSCDSEASLEWDNTSWGLYVSNLDKKVKCNIYFQKTLGGFVRALAKEDSTNLASDDYDNNIRYIGKDPNNYVYFNCSDYNNQNSDTCEVWRIIGLFNNVTKGDGSKENLVKIIRNENIGEYSFDNKNVSSGAETEYGSNDWTISRLNYLLNPGHDSESIGGSLYYNAKRGNCYKGKNNSLAECDFSNSGLKNTKTRELIQDVVWNLGGVKGYVQDANGLAKHWYTMERGTDVYTGRPTTWIGKIAPTSGGSKEGRSECLNKSVYNWENSDNCVLNNYLYDDTHYQWTLTPRVKENYYGIRITFNGNVRANYVYLAAQTVTPVLYLKSNLVISGGSGTLDNAYRLEIK